VQTVNLFGDSTGIHYFCGKILVRDKKEKDPKREKKKFFLQKKFLFLSENPARRGAFQRENKKFFAKIFCFLSFRVFFFFVSY
jgi:hypothetical protein